MTNADIVSGHYHHGALLHAIETGIAKLGKSPSTVTMADLAPVEEFHIGGRAATLSVFDALGLQSGERVLDIGCGIGGPARLAAATYGCSVSGVDLTAEYVATGNALNDWFNLGAKVTLQEANALVLPFPDRSFDKAYMLHVGMNIADKATLAREIARALKPGGRVAIYDVMRTGPGDLSFPVPWAETPAANAAAPTDAYRTVLTDAGLDLVHDENRSAIALDFFAKMRAAADQAGGPPPLGLHILMGSTASTKVANMVSNISAGRLAPVLMIAQKS